MVSKARAKGNKNRRKTINQLEEEGFLVAIVERTGRFIFPKDMFGLFDLVAINKSSIIFVQVSTNRPHSHKSYKLFRKEIPDFIRVEQWCWYDKEKTPKIFKY